MVDEDDYLQDDRKFGSDYSVSQIYSTAILVIQIKFEMRRCQVEMCHQWGLLMIINILTSRDIILEHSFEADGSSIAQL
jgi:hypothetical protein